MDDSQKRQAVLPDKPTDQAMEPSVYEQMWRSMYDYRFGRISFLELLDKWREVLDLPTNHE